MRECTEYRRYRRLVIEPNEIRAGCGLDKSGPSPHMPGHPFFDKKKGRARADVGRRGNEVFHLPFFSRFSSFSFFFR